MKKPTTKKKKTNKKRKKRGFPEGIQAFFLVSLIVVFAIAISLTIISIHTAFNRSPNIPEDDLITSASPRREAAEQQPVTEIERQPASIQPQTQARPTETVSVPAGNPPETLRRPTPEQRPPARPPERPPARPPVPEAYPQERPTERPPERPTVTETVPVAASTAITRPAENVGNLIFVIDDAGNNLRELEPFLRMTHPVTIAVLPGLPHSAEAANRARAAGKEVILHQPMEAVGGQDPGPGAIYYGMSAEEIRAVLSRNIAEVGPVVGMNNHQGSRITMNEEMMRIILEFCKEHDLFFLDSRTTSESVVPAVARQMGKQIAERNIFIDNEQNRDSMTRFISMGLTRAQRAGSAVMIGHAWSPQLAPLLAEKFPTLIEQGFNVISISDKLNQ